MRIQFRKDLMHHHSGLTLAAWKLKSGHVGLGLRFGYRESTEIYLFLPSFKGSCSPGHLINWVCRKGKWELIDESGDGAEFNYYKGPFKVECNESNSFGACHSTLYFLGHKIGDTVD